MERFDSTMVGTLAYFHPCKLHMGRKLGGLVDWAARMTLETIHAHFMEGGLRHVSWNCYGPDLTLQLAHAFLYTGDVGRMDQSLRWIFYSAFQASAGSWNEQHCYPIAKNFAERPGNAWYMGDIPHGWAAAELMLL